MAPQSTTGAKTAAASGFSSSFFLFMDGPHRHAARLTIGTGNGILPRKRHGQGFSGNTRIARPAFPEHGDESRGRLIRAYRFPFLLPRENYGYHSSRFMERQRVPRPERQTRLGLVRLHRRRCGGASGNQGRPCADRRRTSQPRGLECRMAGRAGQEGLFGRRGLLAPKGRPRTARRAPRTPRSPLSGGRPPFAHRIPRFPFLQCLFSQRDQGRRAAGL